MSLTSFLANKEVRDQFAKTIPKPKFSIKKEVLAPPLTQHYGLVGTAFDYLMRFYLKRLNPSALEDTWVAEEAVYQIKDKILLAELEATIERARAAYSRYLKSGKVDDELIRSALLLAQIDPIYRSGFIDKNIGMVDDDDVRDLRNLISIVNPDLFTAKVSCLLNPTFGMASDLVGGADADILLDGTLIDIKTTKDLKLERDHFNQIIGYYILSEIENRSCRSPKFNIEAVGIYYSRHGELYALRVKDLIDEARLSVLIDWFKRTAIGWRERAVMVRMIKQANKAFKRSGFDGPFLEWFKRAAGDSILKTSYKWFAERTLDEQNRLLQ